MRRIIRIFAAKPFQPSMRRLWARPQVDMRLTSAKRSRTWPVRGMFMGNGVKMEDFFAPVRYILERSVVCLDNLYCPFGNIQMVLVGKSHDGARGQVKLIHRFT